MHHINDIAPSRLMNHQANKWSFTKLIAAKRIRSEIFIPHERGHDRNRRVRMKDEEKKGESITYSLYGKTNVAREEKE